MYAPVRHLRQGWAFSVLVPLPEIRTATDPSCSVYSYQPVNNVLEILRKFVGFFLPNQHYIEGGKMHGLFALKNVNPHLQAMEMLEDILKNKSLCNNSSRIKTVRHSDAESTLQHCPRRTAGEHGSISVQQGPLTQPTRKVPGDAHAHTEQSKPLHSQTQI